MYEVINSDGTFTKKFDVTYDNIDYNLLLKPQTATQMCQNTAVCHSDAAGYTLDYFRETNSGWVLTGWHVIFKNMPKENDTFDICTWTKPYKRLQADRNFMAKDSDGNELFRAISRWFLMDTQKRKPLRLPKGFFDKYVPSSYENAILNEDYKHPELDKYKKHSSREFKVTRRDIDSNNHTNNVAYLDWAIDDLTDDIYLNYKIMELRADYSKEAILGDTIRSDFYIRNIDENTVEATSIFINIHDDSHILCRITTKWTKK